MRNSCLLYTSFDALVFACGDAVPVFQQHASEPYNVDLMEVIKTFGEKGKMMIGHCAGAMMFDFVGITAGPVSYTHLIYASRKPSWQAPGAGFQPFHWELPKNASAAAAATVTAPATPSAAATPTAGAAGDATNNQKTES